jgi:superoxide oxidase
MHWLMVLVFIGVFASVNLIDVFPKDNPNHQLFKDIHFYTGMSVLALVVVRIVLRLMGNMPEIVPAPPAWQEKLAKLGHLALYVLMIAMPILGWAALSARGKPIPFSLPPLVGLDKELGRSIMNLHELGGNLAYFLIGGHAAAALYHHYFMKDNTLLRMKLN